MCIRDSIYIMNTNLKQRNNKLIELINSSNETLILKIRRNCTFKWWAGKDAWQPLSSQLYKQMNKIYKRFPSQFTHYTVPLIGDPIKIFKTWKSCCWLIELVHWLLLSASLRVKNIMGWDHLIFVHGVKWHCLLYTSRCV